MIKSSVEISTIINTLHYCVYFVYEWSDLNY